MHSSVCGNHFYLYVITSTYIWYGHEYCPIYIILIVKNFEYFFNSIYMYIYSYRCLFWSIIIVYRLLFCFRTTYINCFMFEFEQLQYVTLTYISRTRSVINIYCVHVLYFLKIALRRRKVKRGMHIFWGWHWCVLVAQYLVYPI